ncbi:MAG: glycosyltransferase family 2 protein [Candidatus Marinimicrobia bacterium]|nr:glycosyltransferase family 2 protein [Candidatus Neomarinimicrobiota bacterium]
MELIIVDNGYDNTSDVISKYINEHKEIIKYYKVNNLTLGEVRNFGVQKAKYNIIGQLDSDDILIDDPVVEIFDQFKSTHAALIIGTYRIATRDLDSGELTISDQIVDHDEFLVHYNNPLLQFCIPGYGAPRYFRKEVFNKVGFPTFKLWRRYYLY